MKICKLLLSIKALLMIGPGLVHIIKDDGGVNSIAGIELGEAGDLLIALFVNLGTV